MKYNYTRLQLITLLLVFSWAASAQNNFWTDVSEARIAVRTNQRVTIPKVYRTLQLDTANLLSGLQTAPMEFTEAAKSKPFVLLIPMPNGSFKSFKIVQAPVMEPGLAARFPNIKTYSGQGIDDPYATIKLDWTELGFHAMIISHVNGSVFIDPYAKGNRVNYISYNKKDISPKAPFIENGVNVHEAGIRHGSIAQRTEAGQCIGATLRKYRLAIACTWQYAVAVAGSNPSKSQTLSAIVTSINRVDGVYETEVDVRFELVNNETKIIYTDSATQPFTGNSDAFKLIDESQAVIDTAIGSLNYDIGHTFSTGGGGLAYLGVVCDSSNKARGITGSPEPVGDPYDIDYVAHEIGHQFNATHPFNAETGSCGDNGDQETNTEPGSGVTIMAYAGICEASNDLEAHSIPYFHAINFDQITNYINIGNGNSCAVPIATGNHPPVVNAGNDYVIPKSTPFVLTGSATDPDSNALTYSWEEMNVGGPFGDWNKPVGDAPIFRSFTPVTTPVRYFPKISDLVNNTTTIGEILPSYARVLKFRLTARDNRAGGGGVCFDENNVTVDGVSGPFTVTAPNTAGTLVAGTFTTITWNVSGTNAAPVNCTTVSIELSTDGGLTFPITLLANTSNDGSEEVVVPNNLTTQARVRVRAVNNIFFDISNVNFTIQASTENGFAFSNPMPVGACTGNAATTVIRTNPLNGFSTPVTLSASGNPAGSTVAFGKNPINPGDSASISLNGNVASGIYNITIKGTAGSVVKTRIIVITVGTPALVPSNLTPANNSTGSTFLPTFTWKPTPDAQYYTLNISTSSAFASSVQSIDSIADSSFTLTTPLSSNTQFYWRVVPHNLCGAGTASAGFLFKTFNIVCGDTAYSNDVPKIIDTVVNTITSVLNIPAGGIIQDVNVVGLKGKHPDVQVLTVTLVSPSNTSVQLFSEQYCETPDFNINFDDAAQNKLTCPLNNNQTAKPLQSLSAFNNENSTGTWTLMIKNEFPGDGGSLVNWGLRICTYQATALPVNWLSFTAYKNGNKAAVLQWSTANEINNDYYEIEKSGDGVSFSSIGKMNAGNHTGLVQQYLFNDLKPYMGVNYYRLKQVDKDGQYNYSSVQKVTFDDAGLQYVIYPNPSVTKSTVRILNEAKKLTLRLSDASGKTVYQQNAGAVNAGQEFEIPVKRFGKGLYILTLVTDKGIANEKLIVQ